jgi:hypothetical protein
MYKLNILSILLCILSIQTLTAQWSTTKLPHPRTRMEGALIDNKVYYAGGYSQIDPVFISSACCFFFGKVEVFLLGRWVRSGGATAIIPHTRYAFG